MEIFVVDAFALTPFTGNQAAVCVLEEPVSDEWLQDLASEMNYSETAFLLASDQAGADFDLRWFTPAYEVDLCGHATLASAHVLWNERRFAKDAMKFSTRSGVLTATRAGEGIELDFPSTPPVECDTDTSLLHTLGIKNEPVFFGRSKYDLFIVVDSAEQLRGLEPDFGKLKRFGYRGFIVTAHSDRTQVDFISRFFAPGAGIDEDPVTGSAHCCLAPYWASELGRPKLVGFQASKRGGVVHVELRADRVLLGGSAITVTAGRLSEQVVKLGSKS